MLTSAKLRGPWYYKVCFLKLYVGVYVGAKFEVSSIILTSFRQGRIRGGGGEGGEDNTATTPPPSKSKPTPKRTTQIRVKVNQIMCLTLVCPQVLTYTRLFVV